MTEIDATGHVVATTAGRVQGTEHRGILRFAGLPYAAPPVGDLRFRPPQPVEPWEGVRDADAFGPISIQNPMVMEQFLGGEPEPQSEDCLFLNVYTPAADDARRPVLVWIHGGAFVMGSGSSPLYDATALVQRGDVVVVTINYRLGVLGFLHLGELDSEYARSGNNGLLDQIAALEWVRDNIAGFGGDPGNVTIFGESAGAMSVGSLLAARPAQGLFHRAIAQSGAAHNVSTTSAAAGVTERFLSLIDGDSIDDILTVDVDKIREIQMTFLVEAFTATDAQLQSGDAVRIPFVPVADGEVLTDRAIDVVAAGDGADVPILVGTTLDEWNLFAMFDMEEIDDQVLETRLGKLTDDGEAAADVYREALPGAPAKALFSAAVTDYVFRQPAVRLAEAHTDRGRPAWTYLFTWATPAMGGVLGSCHALDVPFVFGNLEGSGMAMLVGDDAPRTLSDAMGDAWVAFARSGDPNHGGLPRWPRYDRDRRATMVLDEACSVEEDPQSSRRLLWDGLV